MPVTSARLTSGEIKKIITQEKHRDTHYLTLYWKESTEQRPKRAIVISKQVDKRAVARNRIRRVIGEQIRVYEKDLKGLSLVIKVKKSASNINSQQLRKETVSLLTSSGLI